MTLAQEAAKLTGPSFTAKRVLRLPANKYGRDFVVGDIHGAYDLLIQALKAAKFNPQCDRLLSVGDLVDRGPGSHRVGDFLRTPWVHAVRGNHEAALLAFHEENADDESVYEAQMRYFARIYRAEWWLELTTAQRLDILTQLRKLPLAIEVSTSRGLVGLIHADVPRGMAWPEFVKDLERGDNRTQAVCLEGRTRVRAGDDSGVAGIGRLYVGHTPDFSGAKRLGNVYFMDTGAVFQVIGKHEDGHLSLANIVCHTGAITAPHTQEVPWRIELGDGPKNTPFGVYAKK